MAEAAGYSVHCIDNQGKELFNQYIPSHENAIMFSRSFDNADQYMVAERQRVKTLEVINNGSVKIVK